MLSTQAVITITTYTTPASKKSTSKVHVVLQNAEGNLLPNPAKDDSWEFSQDYQGRIVAVDCENLTEINLQREQTVRQWVGIFDPREQYAEWTLVEDFYEKSSPKHTYGVMVVDDLVEFYEVS